GQEIFTRWLSVPSVSRVRSEGRYFPYAVTHSAGASGAVDASRASHFLFDVSRGEVVSYWLTARNPPRFARAPFIIDWTIFQGGRILRPNFSARTAYRRLSVLRLPESTPSAGPGWPRMGTTDDCALTTNLWRALHILRSINSLVHCKFEKLSEFILECDVDALSRLSMVHFHL